MTTDSKIQTMINNIIDGQGDYNAFSELFLYIVQANLKCTSIKYKIWYEFKCHRWVKIDTSVLYNLFSEKLNPLFVDKKNELCKSFSVINTTSEGWQDTLDKINNVAKIIKSLNSEFFRRDLLRQCAKLSYDPNFSNKLDANIHLLCFENGIYDLKTHQLRDGTPEDYVSLCVGYPCKKYDENDEILKQIASFFHNIQPEINMTNYLLTLFGTCVSGSVREQSLNILYSIGETGARTIIELMCNALGDYCKIMDPTVLSDKNLDASKLENMQGVRMAIIDGANIVNPINCRVTKLFVSVEEIVFESKNEECVHFRHQFKPFIFCNKLNEVSDADDAVFWRRITVIPFTNKITDPDSNISKKIQDWKQTFMSMLLQNYEKIYLVKGLNKPETIRYATMEYKNSCDPYYNFMTMNVEKTDNISDILSVGKLHNLMKDWCRINNHTKYLLRTEFVTYLKKHSYAVTTSDTYVRRCTLKISEEKIVTNEIKNTTLQKEIKDVFSEKLIDILIPFIREGLKSIYIVATNISEKNNALDQVLVIFQKMLLDVEKWNQSTINEETDRIKKKSTTGNYLDGLINDTINSISPEFIHKCYIESSKFSHNYPFLFYNDIDQQHLKQNQTIIETNIKKGIRQIILKMSAMESIVNQQIISKPVVISKSPVGSSLDEIVKMMQSNNITKILIDDGKITVEYKL